MMLSNEAAKRQELEKKQIQAAMAECQGHLNAMRGVQPAEAEKLKQRVVDTIKRYPKLPMDFKQMANAKARSYECFANMRAADYALHEAMRMAQSHQMKESSKLIGEARGFFRKAMSLGADKEFQAAAERKIENVLMTGGILPKGPTVAKPVFHTPKNPHCAKA
ncbi:MAG: hypothetical protein HQL33_03350 [Alphaproteobacteria bacterium]|nr:hypothetical protein [Alphaproteobacteria bacterium]MBF0129008.1 hypothetical protein [Alphaproteobacteria bacterium]